MAGHEIDNKAELTDVRQSHTLSSLAPELMQSGLLFRLNQGDSSQNITKNGFPQLELIGDGTNQMKAESAVKFSSKYETGAELTSDRELRQAGLNPRDVKHTVKKEENRTSESSSVKYPNGLEVTVTGHTKHMPSGRDVVLDPDATIKEPLPKGYRKDKEGGIYDGSNKQIAQKNEDGTVTVKVGNEYLTQGPAGVREETVIGIKRGTNSITRLPVEN